MNGCDGFWKLEHLSDGQLLESLGNLVAAKRRVLAELVAHLGEVEERRIHLQSAHGSMFEYCVARLGMSEDEACRRIELARLARRFPSLFPLLASGEISLSVALVLKPVLSPENHVELLAAARGSSIRAARELVAARFPQPDAPSSIRKLPEQRNAAACVEPEVAPLPAGVTVPPSPPAQAPGLVLSVPERIPPAPSRSRTEPTSAHRYKIQFAADANLREKLERARDLLRYAHPDGDFGPIVSRALDLLIDDLMRRRFGAGARAKKAAGRRATADTRSTHIPNVARRAVLERDGLRCSWVDESGRRCDSQAWLELDHRQPRGRGGGSDADNVRILCHAHNQFAAEQEYGRSHMERSRRKRRRDPPAVPGFPCTNSADPAGLGSE